MKHSKTSHERMKEYRRSVRRALLKETLWLLPVFLGMTIFLLGAGNDLAFVLGGFVAGLSGVIVIVTKEMPSALVSLKGTPAVFVGVLFVVMTWGLSLVILVMYVLHR